ncbi:HAD-IIA family hydrolase [Saccharomonospora sp. CUA-673]|uniref:HAD-IIA family hydrolase n=1 Tax=Saccharomonospora sp. CUA-673 TaxID=1904969 RepID=UPI000AB14FC2|nr:HAD hydrolase-like protein [Saccharomonospora sp. CUA-673]
MGGPGVANALAEAGLTPVRVAELDDGPVEAVMQGLGFDITWRELAAVGPIVDGGAPWVATNLDRTLPTPRGRAPGNGALVALVQETTSAAPHVVGKPQPALFDLARARLGSEPADTLVCGDLLHTDIEGANAAGLDSLFVLSGSSRLRDLALADRPLRPTYVAPDIGGLLEPGLPVPAEPVADLLELGPGGIPRVPGRCANPGSGGTSGNGGTSTNGGNAALLQAVVATAWAARDEGRALSDDAKAWEDLERRLGLVEPV